MFLNLSKQDRKLWLSMQFTLFEQEVENFIKEKNNLVEQLYERLKKVTRRWASWNHKNFGPVVSREQVRHLRNWERQNQPKLEHEGNVTDAFERFECYCKMSLLLLKGFRQHIYTPLCEYLMGNALIYAEENVKSLDKCLVRWEHLLQNSNFSKKAFTKQSLTFLNIYLPMRKTENDLILRLIPDLIETKLQVLNVLHKSLENKTTNFDRSGTYILPPLLQRETTESICTYKYKLTSQLNSQLDEMCCEPSKFQQLTEELDFTRQRCAILEVEVKTLKSVCKNLEEQLQNALNVNTTLDFCNKAVENASTYKGNKPMQHNQCEDESRRIANELAHVKVSYSTQKIKYMNAKKKIKILNKQLDLSSYRVSSLMRKYQEKNAEPRLPPKNNKKRSKVIDICHDQCLLFKKDLNKTITLCDKISGASNELDTANKKKLSQNLQITKEQKVKEEPMQTKENFELEANSSTQTGSVTNILYKETLTKNNKTNDSSRLDSPKSNETDKVTLNSTKESMFPDINCPKNI